MDKYVEAVARIINEQTEIVGLNVALMQARKVPGLNLENANNIIIVGEPKQALTDLVNKYAELFGQASVEVCKDAIRKVHLTPDELPEILK